MQRQRDMQVTGVRDRCVSEAGATALLRNSRAGCAALVAPASALEHTDSRPTADRIWYLEEVSARTALDPQPVHGLDRNVYQPIPRMYRDET